VFGPHRPEFSNPKSDPQKLIFVDFGILGNYFFSNFNYFQNNLINAEFVKEYDKSGGVN
jgi:hypothetical protein